MKKISWPYPYQKPFLILALGIKFKPPALPVSNDFHHQSLIKLSLHFPLTMVVSFLSGLLELPVPDVLTPALHMAHSTSSFRSPKNAAGIEGFFSTLLSLTLFISFTEFKCQPSYLVYFLSCLLSISH